MVQSMILASAICRFFKDLGLFAEDHASEGPQRSGFGAQELPPEAGSEASR